VQLSNAGGRLIIASDGVWDALTSDKAAKCCRGLLQPDVAAKHIVKVRTDFSGKHQPKFNRLSDQLLEFQGYVYAAYTTECLLKITVHLLKEYWS
jgi:hypothetical protein